MKKTLSSFIVAGMLTSLPVLAKENETWQEKIQRQLRNEQVTQAIGAVTGALIGTQIGGGKGKVLAIAAGTLAGYWLGGKLSGHLKKSDHVGIANTTERAIQTGKTTSWENPDTGMQTRVSVSDAPPADGYSRNSYKKAKLDQLPPIKLANSYYTPSADLNVRGGAGTDYQVLHTLKQGTEVPVIGRVIDTDWLLIAENGKASGFVYAPLMRLSNNQDQYGNAIRDSVLRNTQPQHIQLATSSCRWVTQDVTLRDGRKDSHSFEICRQADGNWMEV
jgi:surface antigen